MSSANIGDIVFLAVILLLILLFFVSLALFIRRLSVNQRRRIDNQTRIEEKLDMIIELLKRN